MSHNGEFTVFDEDSSNKLFKAISNEDVSAVTAIFSNPKIKPWRYKNKEGFNSLQTACFKNYFPIVKAILEQLNIRLSPVEVRDVINEKATTGGYTAIHYASFKGNIETIKILEKNGADIYVTNFNHLNVLHMAAQGDQPISIVYFKEYYNFDHELKDKIGSSPLHWACYTGSVNAFKYLIAINGINLNSIDNDGLTPLHLCIMAETVEKLELIKKLLRAGADRTIKDKKGRTPLELAKTKKNADVLCEMLANDDCKGCQMSVVKIPLQKLEKSNFNIYFFIIIHCLVAALMLLIVLPIHNDPPLVCLYIANFLLVITFFFILMSSNSGIIENKSGNTMKTVLEIKSVKITDYCPYCVVKITSTSKHCFICNKCVDEWDHHCFWVNNCIAKKNLWIFVLFVFFVFDNLILNTFISGKTLSLYFDETLLTSKYYKPFPPIFTPFRSLYSNTCLNVISILVMLVCFCFFVPVSILLYIHFRNLFRQATNTQAVQLNTQITNSETNPLLTNNRSSSSNQTRATTNVHI